jgi:hypothetical protein
VKQSALDLHGAKGREERRLPGKVASKRAAALSAHHLFDFIESAREVSGRKPERSGE